VSLDLTADFEARRLRGTATLTFDASPGARQIVLDTRKLDVQAVTSGSGAPLEFTAGAEQGELGRPLVIQLPEHGDQIVIHYQTAPQAQAVQWLEPGQTAGGIHPYLSTPGQAILTRTWIPTQDSPGIRQTYAAAITVPPDLTAV